MTEARYLLRFFFDYGSESCLWPGNDAARRKFAYPVDPNGLGLSGDLLARIRTLAACHDTSIDWNDPGGPSPWTVDEQASFEAAAKALLLELRAALGAEFLVQDELIRREQQ
jgi:hypothetical protein